MRTFIAIELPPGLQPYIDRTQRAIARALSPIGAQDIRWTTMAKFHLTLRFLGETQPDQAERLAAALARIAGNHAAFELTIDGRMGCYPSMSRPSVLWLGLGGDLPALHALQSATEAAAVAAGFVPESRPFSPHLTIGRVARSTAAEDRRTLGRRLAQLARPAAPPAAFTATEVVQIQSDLQPGGAVYTVLGRYPLTPGQ